MDVLLEKKRWVEVFSEFDVVDISIQEKERLQLCARRRLDHEVASQLADHQIPTRLITLFTDRPVGENCGFTELIGMTLPIVGVARQPFVRPSGLVAAFNKDGDVWPRGGGADGPMEHIAPGAWPGPKRLKCINGYTYAVCTTRHVYKRVAVGKWVLLADGLPDATPSSALGFRDMDAFSESDMYAVGGHGDVWHFNGTRWQQMGFPSNVQLGTVTCAGDGNVYISGEGGSLWVGGKSTWKPIYKGHSSILWNDTLWFQDKLWLASDYEFRQLKGKTLEPVMDEGEKVHMNGHMDVYDGLLAIASAEYVSSFDGDSWRRIVEPYLD